MQPPSLPDLPSRESTISLSLSDEVVTTITSTLSASSSLLPTPTQTLSTSFILSTPSIPTTATTLPIPAQQNTLPTLTGTAYSTTTMGLSMSKPTGADADSSNPLLMQRPGDCELLGSFALFVQLALGALALMSLVWKRYRERPQRPVKIWFFDVSKQIFGSGMVHVANVFMAMLTSGRFSVKLTPRMVSEVGMILKREEERGYQPNPCSWYLLNLAVDTTLGIPILILLLRLYTCLALHTPLGSPPESLQSGYYGSPPNAIWWLKQSFIYFCGLFGMKIVVLILFVLFPWISHIGDWALRWTEGNEQLQIVFVMMLFPLIMNAMQYYVIDSFIKKQGTTDEPDDQETRGRHTLVPDSEDAAQRLAEVDPSFDDDSSIDDEIRIKNNIDRRSFSTKSGERSPVIMGEYDSKIDGDTPTVFGSSSSQMGR